VIRTELLSNQYVESSSGLVLRIHPNSHLMVAEKNLIANHIVLGKDFVTFDSRGYREGNSLCSEAGIYIDAMTVYEQVLSWGYLPQDIWITAKCGGSPAVLFLKERYGHDFNMVLENSYLDKKRTNRQNVPLAHYIGWDILQCLDVKKEETIQVVRNLGLERFCDRFENESKLRRIDEAHLNRNWQGKTVIISAQRDLSVEPEAGYELSRLAAKVSKNCYHLIHALPDDQADGHRDQALVNDHQLIRIYSQILLKARVHHEHYELNVDNQPRMPKSLENLRFQLIDQNTCLDAQNFNCQIF